jgi:hypothetical protein
VLDHRHADRVTRHVAEVVAALGEAGGDGAMHVVGGRSRAHRGARRVVVLAVGVRHVRHLAVRTADRPGDLDPVHARPGDLERRQDEVAERRLLPRDRELGADEHHVHRQSAAAALDEQLLGGGHHFTCGAARPVGGEEGVEAVLVDPHAVTNGRQLDIALHRTGEVEGLVERHELEPVERLVVAHAHHVVEAVDAHAAPARVAGAVGDQCSRPLVEELLDPRGAVLADVARLAREGDERVAVRRHHDVGVAVHDLEPREVRDGALEPRVLAAGDDQRVELVLRHRAADVVVPVCQLCVQLASTPLMSATMASLSGVGTPCSRPKRAMPPFR